MELKERNYAFDNLKGLLGFLVVFGHLIQFTRGRTEAIVRYLYTAIYLFIPYAYFHFCEWLFK